MYTGNTFRNLWHDNCLPEVIREINISYVACTDFNHDCCKRVFLFLFIIFFVFCIFVLRYMPSIFLIATFNY